ncbi:MAG: hypothetical protein ACXVCO_20395 [Ktedonobacterales bacterium]
MRVRCIATSLTARQRERLGRRAYLDTDVAALTIGKDYLVFGLEFMADNARIRTGAYVWVIADEGGLAWFDLGLFTITDQRMSRYWVLRTWGVPHVRVRLWPAQWEAALERSPNYAMHLSAGEPEAVADFQRLHVLLDTEFDETAV